MDKYLIINADDFGMCHAQNAAIMDLLDRDCITSSTIMGCCPWAKEAVEYAKNHPEKAIGVHLTTTSEWGHYRWTPLSAGASLRDEEGYMWHESDQFAENADLEETKAEIEAQIAFLKGLGLNPSHLDNHMGSLYGVDTGRFELLLATLEIAGKHGLPFRLPTKFKPEQIDNEMLDIKVPPELVTELLDQFAEIGKANGVGLLDYLMPGDWAGPQNESYENFREYIYEMYRTFDNGITETYIHPAMESEELKSITGNWHRRVWEYRLFSDPATRQHIDALGIKLINYRDLAKMRAEA